MEENEVLVEEIMLNMKQDKSKISFWIWLSFLRKAWPVYIIMVVFTILFTVLYVLSGNIFQFYLSIFYPILLLLILIGEGIFKNVKALKLLEKDFKKVKVGIYTNHIALTNQIQGINHIRELPYDVMKRIIYHPASEEILFEVHKENHFTIPRDTLQEETFQFLMNLIQEKEKKENK